MLQERFIKPDSLFAYREPFSYFMAEASLDQEVLSSLIPWLESKAHWKLVETDFYEQYELVWTEGQLPAAVSFLRSPAFLDVLRREVGDIFNRSFVPEIDWSVHKQVSGQRMRIHNDLLTGGETHRVVLHLTREWSISWGGVS